MSKNLVKNLTKPLLLFPQKIADKKIINNLKRDRKIKFVDEFQLIVKDIQEVINPSQKIDKSKEFSLLEEVWVYYPWRQTLVRLVEKNIFRKVRLSRNDSLITLAEQKKFTKIKVGIVGMNVGYHAAICLALEGGAEKMKFADPDILTLSSLNRFRSGLSELGENKTILSAQQVYEVDPFYSLDLYSQGISEKNIDKFLNNPRIDLLIEEMDNLPLKLFVRQRAKKYKIPVIMVTGNGENLILDIERYDQKKQPALLNGYINKGIINKVNNFSQLSKQEKVSLAKDFIGSKYLSPRLLKSFSAVGITLAGIPQIAETSFLRGVILTQVVRKFASQTPLPSGRYFVKIDNIFK
jgi:molybdopterin/thiamine biosynthesis adenylyltransferase